MIIRVITVSTFLDLGDTIEKYIVKMCVEGQVVTVTMFDTTLSILVQAGSMQEPYCRRVLIPYLEKKIRKNDVKIKKINEEVKTIVVPKATTRQQHKEVNKGTSTLSSAVPSTPSDQRRRKITCRSPLGEALVLPPHSLPQPEDSSPLALPPPASPEKTPGLLARAASWLPGVLSSPFLSSPRPSPQDEQQCPVPASPEAPWQKGPQATLDEAGLESEVTSEVTSPRVPCSKEA